MRNVIKVLVFRKGFNLISFLRSTTNMADVSLDDLIYQRKNRFGRQPGVKMNDGGGKNWVPMKGRLSMPQYADHTAAPKGFGDVRNKIIQNKRLRMHDARDRLAELAKQGDARERINKMRKKNVPLKKSPVTRAPQKLIHNENRPSCKCYDTSVTFCNDSRSSI
ncbi:hypothetical protein GWK47_025885 [Chionoecetes opilio]|uniref:Uncharacterized protein n=1 Tax=Chionoecetes opilio TaxID=41210 RepID=A0A8J8WAT8_CHIOP|nr:hypothetical protein GWK47_025885 [Chionoecetes opilio]